MSYMMLVVEQPDDRARATADEGRSRMARMTAWGEALEARGLLAGSNSLRSSAEGARVQVRDGRRSLVDGPFAEAKEMIGGYFLLTCPSREEAIAIAGECPAAEWAVIEVRQIGPCSE